MTTHEPETVPAPAVREPVCTVIDSRSTHMIRMAVIGAAEEQGAGDFMVRPEEIQINWARPGVNSDWSLIGVIIRGPRVNPGPADHKIGSRIWSTWSATIPGWAQKIVSDNWPRT